MLKWIIGIVVIALAATALWWSGWLGKIIPSQPAPAPQAETQPTPQAEVPANGMSASADTSDAALSQDAAAVAAQMQALSTDATQVDASVTDKPVQ
jgi:hypothetical protein